MDTWAIRDPSSFINQNHFMRYNHIFPGGKGDDWAEVYLDVEKNATNAYGQVHGGALFAMADCCAGLVARLDGRFYVTQDASTQFIHNVDSGRITARGTVVHRGHRVCLVRVEIHAETGRLLFHGIFSMFWIRLESPGEETGRPGTDGTQAKGKDVQQEDVSERIRLDSVAGSNPKGVGEAAEATQKDRTPERVRS